MVARSYSTNAVKSQPAQITTQDDGSEWDGGDRVFIGTQDSTAQHSTAQHSTAQHSTAQHSTAQRNNNVIQYSMM